MINLQTKFFLDIEISYFKEYFDFRSMPNFIRVISMDGQRSTVPKDLEGYTLVGDLLSLDTPSRVPQNMVSMKYLKNNILILPAKKLPINTVRLFTWPPVQGK